MSSAEASNNKSNRKKLPELLSPAGSPAAMLAAVNAGADAVYFGMPEFNARIGADNFTAESLPEYIRLCHLMGVKAYVTLNTQIYDKEKESFLATAKSAYQAGVDAAIVGDLGAAALLRKHFPELPIHASTQLSGHNSRSGAELAKLGFSRMVLAREMSLEDIKSFTEESPIEAEIFIHGALCVCHSGQCLFSSMVGGRSGNRGLCAQPCRLPYKMGGRYEGTGEKKGSGAAGKESYPLSLKDSCLALHIPEIIESGAASLKIEGRMKPADYVGRVTAVYRRLLNEGRSATAEEMRYLADVFSRNGFTDGYFTNRISSDMLGVRSEKDKERSRRLMESDEKLPERKVGVYMCAEIRKDAPMKLTVGLSPDEKARYGEVTEVTAEGAIPFEAINRPTDKASAEKNLTKLGGTVFTVQSIEIKIDDGLMVPVSALNELRRNAVAALEEALLAPYNNRKEIKNLPSDEAPRAIEKIKTPKRVAYFTELKQIPPSARRFFDEIYLPATEFLRHGEKELEGVRGVILPAVIFDSEKDEVRGMLAAAREKGATEALAGNLGHAELARESGFNLHGDFRLNVSNLHTAESLTGYGFSDIVLSPELTLPKARDISRYSQIECRTVVYGRLPLMVVEKCVICESLDRKGRELCPIKAGAGGRVCRGTLTDRTGAVFPVIREYDHRNVIYNSLPIYMGDRQDELIRMGICSRVFIFSDESAERAEKIIEAYEKEAPPDTAVRRIGAR